MKCAGILVVEMPLQSIRQSQVIDLHPSSLSSIKRNGPSSLSRKEINRALGENTLDESTIGKYVRMFVFSVKETDTPVVPESEGDFSFDDHIALALSEEPFLSVCQIAKKVVTSK
jgi:hypothetical protein